jgi:hypothetical protein
MVRTDAELSLIAPEKSNRLDVSESIFRELMINGKTQSKGGGVQQRGSRCKDPQEAFLRDDGIVLQRL